MYTCSPIQIGDRVNYPSCSNISTVCVICHNSNSQPDIHHNRSHTIMSSPAAAPTQSKLCVHHVAFRTTQSITLAKVRDDQNKYREKYAKDHGSDKLVNEWESVITYENSEHRVYMTAFVANASGAPCCPR
jgi:hypothetical protein